jgi:hypothetical protein
MAWCHVPVLSASMRLSTMPGRWGVRPPMSRCYSR